MTRAEFTKAMKYILVNVPPQAGRTLFHFFFSPLTRKRNLKNKTLKRNPKKQNPKNEIFQQNPQTKSSNNSKISSPCVTSEGKSNSHAIFSHSLATFYSSAAKCCSNPNNRFNTSPSCSTSISRSMDYVAAGSPKLRGSF